MPYFVKLDENNLVEQATLGQSTPPGFLRVVPATPTIIEPPKPEIEEPLESDHDVEPTDEAVVEVSDEDPLMMEEEAVAPEPTIIPYKAAPGEVGIEADVPLAAVAEAMRVGDVLLPRPYSPQPRAEDGKIIIPPCPAGTEITVYDLSGKELMGEVIAETDDFEEVIEFSDPGVYEVEVQAPMPHLFTRQKVEIE